MCIGQGQQYWICRLLISLKHKNLITILSPLAESHQYRDMDNEMSAVQTTSRMTRKIQ